MYKTRFFLSVICVLLFYISHSQQINVTSFHSLPGDTDARQKYPETDKSGKTCALIKIMTTKSDLSFNTDNNQKVIKTVLKADAIWVYIPGGSQSISISDNQTGEKCNYIFPMEVAAGAGYELILSGISEGERGKGSAQWLVINTNPPGADLFIDDQPAGQTPYQNELSVGKHSYRISLDLYLPQSGTIEIKENEGRKIIELNLIPNFGTINLTTTPENGASVSIDGFPTGKTTPCTLEKIPSGEHVINISLSDFITVKKQVTIAAGQTQEVTVAMSPLFATVNIKAGTGTHILINGVEKGTGTWKGRLNPGTYTFTGKKDKHADANEQQNLLAGQETEITLTPEPITGTLKVKTDPYDATVIIDGQTEGQTPLTLNNLLIGEHQMEITKDGYTSLKQTVTIKENEETVFNENLMNFKQVTIESNPAEAKLIINGKAEGSTPVRLSLQYGSHTINLNKPGYQPLTEKITVTDRQETYHFNLVSNEAFSAGAQYSKFKKYKIISLSAGAAFAVAGTFFWLQSEKHADEYPDATTNATSLHNDIEREQRLARIAFGASAACLITAGIYHYKQKKAGRSLDVSVSAGPGNASIELSLNL